MKCYAKQVQPVTQLHFSDYTEQYFFAPKEALSPFEWAVNECLIKLLYLLSDPIIG